ncbi:MAG: DoxX family protein [Elusimicrobium sp.]|jgi:uncharacterized membrane protein YphA (DoxX/SURF4 family)|nr:DoxX family protein [Elusimicrobium sp.]
MKVKTTCVCVVDETAFSVSMLVSRLLCSAAAVYFVFGILLNFRSAADMVMLKFNITIPSGVIVAESILGVIAAFAFLLGYRTKLTAICLMVFWVINGVIFFGADVNNFFLFFILVAVAGLTPAVILGPGKYSLDFKKAELENSKFLSK